MIWLYFSNFHRAISDAAARREMEMKKRSQAVQRNLPRPQEVNVTVLRPMHADVHLSDQQKAEELIKREMVTMLHYDALHTPASSQGGRKGKESFGISTALLLAYVTCPSDKPTL